MRPLFRNLLILAVVLVGSVKFYDWWIHRHTITLSAKDAEIQSVLKQIAKQSACPVISTTNTTGKVTVDFERTPVDQALGVLADQLEGNLQNVYLVARRESNFPELISKLRDSGPPFLLTRTTGISDEISVADPKNLDFEVQQLELSKACLKLGLRIQTPFLVQEGLNLPVSVKFQHASLEDIIAGLEKAGRVRIQLAFYFRVGGRGGRGNWTAGGGGGGGRGGSNRGFGGIGSFQNPESEERFKAQMDLLPEADKAKITQMRDEWQQRMAGMANLTPEERRQKMQEILNDPKMQARMEKRTESRLKNQTPEQRAARYKRMAQREKQRKVRGQ